MTLTLTHLTNLVIQVDRPDIQTVDALFVKMLDDQPAARMLSRLLYWFPKAVKIGGWVYKSWRDWDAECGLSQAQIKRVHQLGLLEQFGMTRKLMKANGAPTTHYVLNFDQLLKQIAHFLALSLEQVRSFLEVTSSSKPPTPKKKDITPSPQVSSEEDEAEIERIREQDRQQFLRMISEETGLSIQQLEPLDKNILRRMMQAVRQKAPMSLKAIHLEVPIDDLLLHAFEFETNVTILLSEIMHRYRQHHRQ